METRKESLSSLKVCRFCLTQNESLSSLYEKSKAPKNSVTLSTKIMTCVAIEVFPSDKMPQYICNRCKLFMDLSYGFKQICRQADQNILHFVQNGTTIEPLSWPSLLNKVYKAQSKSEVGMVKTVTQDGATVKVTAEEVSDSEEGDDDNVYSVKIGHGSEKSIKVITSVDNQDMSKDNRKSVKYENDSEDEPANVIVNEGCWPCDECECTYPLEQLLTLHKAQKHRARNVQCEECDAKFFSKYDLMTHQLRHLSDFPFQCVACDRKYKRFVLLKRHEKLMHSDLSQMKCLKCPATFLSQIELDAHETKHLPKSSRLHHCSLCDKRFVENSALLRHIETIHNKKPQYACNYCPERFPNMTKLGKHLRTHAGERAYPCKHCDKSFLKSHHYTRHLRVKHSESLRAPSGRYTEAESYRCEECEECFHTQDELIYHSALHATRSLTCPLCQEKFHDVDTVTTHIKSHVNGAEFMCDFCELIFTTQEKLDTHIVISHDNDSNDKDTTENEDEDYSMDAEGFEEEHSIDLKEVDGQVVVEIKKAGDYMITDTDAIEDDENNAIDPSEASELEISLNDATSPLLASKPSALDEPPKPPIPTKRSETIAIAKTNPGFPSIVKKAEEIKQITVQKQASAVPVIPASELEISLNDATSPLLASKPSALDEPPKPPIPTKRSETIAIAKTNPGSPIILRKAEDIKQITVQKQASAVPVIPVVKDKPVVEIITVPPTPAPANDLSLRLLEKELQDLQRTNTRNDVAKTPAKPMESLKNKRSQIHTSTPKPRPIEKKEVPAPKPAPEKTPKSALEKPVPEKKPLGRPPKENREVKNTIKEDKDTKDKATVNVKDEKETKEEKETPKVVKNGATERTSVEEPVRRSTRPSKVKDYAKMIRDSPDEDEESTEEDEEMEESKEQETEKSIETPRRGRKPLPKSPAVATPALPVAVPRKRGRPRKDQAAVPPKVCKTEESQEKEGSEDDESASEPAAVGETKLVEAKSADVSQTETKSQTTEPANVIMSPSGQTLKKVPIKALPPGVKPMPLPRKMTTSGEVCEMQIGKKVVKVQKIVMTKAEVEAMTKKGLVEMKDGTIVLKQGIKLPGGGASTLKSQLAEEQKKESPKGAKPTRCDFGGD